MQVQCHFVLYKKMFGPFLLAQCIMTSVVYVNEVDETQLPFFQKTRALVTLFRQAGALLYFMLQFRTSWIKRFQRN